MKGTTSRRPLRASVALLLTAVLLFVFVLPAGAAKPGGTLFTTNTIPASSCDQLLAQVQLDGTWFAHKAGWVRFDVYDNIEEGWAGHHLMFIAKGTTGVFNKAWNFPGLGPSDYQVRATLYYGKGKDGSSVGKQIDYDWANDPVTVEACP